MAYQPNALEIIDKKYAARINDDGEFEGTEEEWGEYVRESITAIFCKKGAENK